MPTHQGYSPIQQIMDNPADVNTGRPGLPSTYSSQQLMPDSDSVTVSENERMERPRENSRLRSVSMKNWFTVGVLCFVNLINYMDRLTIAGVLTPIQDYFNIADDEGGLLQTAFVLSYMIFAPIFGYLGDRYSRRWIMVIGVLLWSGTTLIGSFMTAFGWFITFRALVGIGEASYSTIAPTLISDLFIHDMRSKFLALFYFAIPIGSGLGYIVGSETANLAGSWQWALRVTPVLGSIAVVLLFLITEPERGQSEGNAQLETTSYKEDLRHLLKNRSFMLSTSGFTCVTFVTGALSWWGPKFIHLGLQMQPGGKHLSLNEVSFIFGLITMIAGLFGVPLGSMLSQMLIKRFPSIDPLLCGLGLFISVPFVAGAFIVVTQNTIATFALVFFGELALNMNWAIVADILMYVVVPTRRSTAGAFQILISHTFGDAGSPYLVGVFSEVFKRSLRESSRAATVYVQDGLESLSLTVQNSTVIPLSEKDTTEVQFHALQYALFSTCFVQVLGGVFFLLAAIFVIRDKSRASQTVRDVQEGSPNHTFADSSTIS